MLIQSLLKGVTAVDDNNILKGVVVNNPSPRENFINAVKSQISLVEYDMKPEGEPIKGKKWYKVVDKNAYTFVRYSVKKIKILPTQTDDKAALRVGTTYASLIKFYENLIKVAEAGELDDVLDNVAAEMIAERKASRERNAADPEYQAKREATKAKRETKLLENHGGSELFEHNKD
ncbi:hypothetical protein GHA01_24620 [Novacetimonas hansenii]|uniref:Uncharacterized protein n=2 Tax=Novacetimonas hansenii TaxID=436 RepID=A0ABQ0SHJ5_NOVHA|nr:hypothetical protein AA0243_1021 [Novacetimonas hansenii NRIC 0243]GEC64613.1 hypothetical protein GHA01_24620 [Novacetimonas hansenii]